MINSIQHFCAEGVKKSEKVMLDYSDDMTKTAEMIRGGNQRSNGTRAVHHCRGMGKL